MHSMFFIMYIDDEKEHSNRIMHRQYNAQNITLNDILSIKWQFVLIILRINTFKLTIMRYFAFLMKIVDTIY